jgi:hypothetical protein
VKINKRNRLYYGLFIIIVITLGLASRRYSSLLPGVVGNYAGDILWAFMVFLGMGFIFKNWSISRVGLTAFLFCFSIEITQLYHAAWIDSIRRTTLGALVLGFGFLWSDLICYSVGISIGILLEIIFLKPLLQ